MIRRLTMEVSGLRFGHNSLLIKNNDKFFTQNDKQVIVNR